MVSSAAGKHVAHHGFVQGSSMIDIEQQLGVSMAKHKHYDYRQTKMLPISFDRQILPGTFEHTLSELIDSQVDLSVFEERYKNDAGGAPAHDPAILLKVILFAALPCF